MLIFETEKAYRNARIAKNDIVFCEDVKKYFQNGAEVKFESKEMSNGITMNVYDLNKQIIASTAPSSKEKNILDIDFFASENGINKDHHIYMLLNNELHYYTVFIYDWTLDGVEPFGEAVFDCANAVGKVHSTEYDAPNDALDIWVIEHTTNEPCCLHLFNYDEGVVYYGGR